MTHDKLQQIVIDALEDTKARDISTLDVRDMTTIADTMIIASGTSDRHVRALADSVIEKAREAGYRPYGVEGQNEGEWVLVDLQDVIVHLMLPKVRDFYNLEKLWAPAREPDLARVDG